MHTSFNTPHFESQGGKYKSTSEFNIINRDGINEKISQLRSNVSQQELTSPDSFKNDLFDDINSKTKNDDLRTKFEN